MSVINLLIIYYFKESKPFWPSHHTFQSKHYDRPAPQGNFLTAWFVIGELNLALPKSPFIESMCCVVYWLHISKVSRDTEVKGLTLILSLWSLHSVKGLNFIIRTGCAGMWAVAWELMCRERSFAKRLLRSSGVEVCWRGLIYSLTWGCSPNLSRSVLIAALFQRQLLQIIKLVLSFGRTL